MCVSHITSDQDQAVMQLLMGARCQLSGEVPAKAKPQAVKIKQ